MDNDDAYTTNVTGIANDLMTLLKTFLQKQPSFQVRMSHLRMIPRVIVFLITGTNVIDLLLLCIWCIDLLFSINIHSIVCTRNWNLSATISLNNTYMLLTR